FFCTLFIFQLKISDERLLIILVAYGRLNAQVTAGQLNSAATFGHNFMTLFPSNNQFDDENPDISLTLINSNLRRAYVQIKYSEDAENAPEELTEFTVIVAPMSYKTVHFNESSINVCDDAFSGKYMVACSDSRIYISSERQPIGVFSHWFLPHAGDSFLVLPSSMATNRYAFSAPAPAEDGLTRVYFLPLEDSTLIKIAGEIDDHPFKKSFSPKMANGNLMTIQTTGNLALIASANVSFAVIVAVEKLRVSLHDNRTDFGAYMPVPLLDFDYHVSMMLDAQKFLVTQGDLFCNAEFTVFNDMENQILFPLKEVYNEVEFADYSQYAGIDSSSVMLQVLRYGGWENEFINGSYLDLDISWSQFVTGLTTFFVPSDENIITIIGDTEATTTTTAGNRAPIEFVWNWTPISLYHKTFYYCTISLPKGFYIIVSSGSYVVFVAGQIQNAAYGFVTAYNKQISKDLPEIKTTTTEPRMTTTTPSKDV
uniref:IgGFc_binding domain-containing protein n=1 Tax=Elaeophora elaphi TaxID=1147741 RepID=A0A0R3RXD8_9BILA